MAADSALPAYRDKLLGEGRTAGRARPEKELFFHLGYWPDPASAGHDFPDLVAAQARLNDRLLALSDLKDGLRVLDVGCGIGGTVAALGGRYDALSLTGLNIDRAQLGIARASVHERPSNRYAWVEADACALPFADASFDRLLAVECIFHFPSRRQFFAEAARVTCPGGRLVFSDFVTSAKLRSVCPPGDPAGAALERNVCDGVGPWPDFWGENSDNVAIAREVGFSLRKAENASRSTLPSYRCFLPGKPIEEPLQATDPDPVDRAMASMEWLQSKGLVDMVFFAFSR